MRQCADVILVIKQYNCCQIEQRNSGDDKISDISDKTRDIKQQYLVIMNDGAF